MSIIDHFPEDTVVGINIALNNRISVELEVCAVESRLFDFCMEVLV
jgi:hypothetical protein